jgi:hypothetical protein
MDTITIIIGVVALLIGAVADFSSGKALSILKQNI